MHLLLQISLSSACCHAQVQYWSATIFPFCVAEIESSVSCNTGLQCYYVMCVVCERSALLCVNCKPGIHNAFGGRVFPEWLICLMLAFGYHGYLTVIHLGHLSMVDRGCVLRLPLLSAYPVPTNTPGPYIGRATPFLRHWGE